MPMNQNFQQNNVQIGQYATPQNMGQQQHDQGQQIVPYDPMAAQMQQPNQVMHAQGPFQQYGASPQMGSPNFQNNFNNMGPNFESPAPGHFTSRIADYNNAAEVLFWNVLENMLGRGEEQHHVQNRPELNYPVMTQPRWTERDTRGQGHQKSVAITLVPVKFVAMLIGSHGWQPVKYLAPPLNNDNPDKGYFHDG